ncbi:hypothetical protein DAETH_43170 (plasmid) [Deinococcus aetherius]|uniref:Glycosyltransferase RgtA/B/C/D-like domain-containing protein n=1 Tax=Deinococcus aetherius TaxID=200252 RepID=A0ABM8AKK0_9DEIO|nr:hypothetical protein DAETH_43170 [Deinococcus aetherius]
MAVTWGLLALVFGLRWLALSHIDLDRLSDYGLTTALPRAYFAALIVLAGSFYWQLTRARVSTWLLAIHVLSLIVMLHGLTAFLYDEPRFAWTYKHVGVVGYILEHGTVDPGIDAYHNWPGFFALAAAFTAALGLPSPLPFAGYAQLAFNLLYLPALLLLFRSLTPDARTVWHATWLFYATSWVSQDYFAPQALAYFFHLIILAVCLTWLSGVRTRPPPPGGEGGSVRAGALAVYRRVRPDLPGTLAVLLLFAAVACSHQLTPFMTVAAVSALVLARVCRVRTLPLWMLALTVLWNVTMASTYLSGHNQWYAGLGALLANLSKNVPDAQNLSTAHAFVVGVTRVMTLGMWGLAALGAWRMWRAGARFLAPGLLALAPFPLLALQAYGGEMLLRIYFFALPFMAFLVAHALLCPAGPGSPARLPRFTPLPWLVSALLLGAMTVAYFGNESTNHIHRDEVQAARWLYGHAPPGSAILTVSTNNFPVKISGNYNEFTHLSLTDDQGVQLSTLDFDHILSYSTRQKLPALYIVLSEGQRTYVNLYKKLHPGSYDGFQRSVARSPEFRRVYASTHVTIYASTLNPFRR